MDNNELIKVSVQYNKTINYAMHQSFMGVIDKVVIENSQDKELKNLKLNIKSYPQIFKEVNIDISYLPQKRAVDLGIIDSKIETDVIMSLTENVNGEIIITLEGEDLQNTIKLPIEIVTYNSFPNLNEKAELIAAFSMPNHPYITEIVARSRKILEDTFGVSSLEGYKNVDVNQVKQELSAIFTSVSEKEISFVNTKNDKVRFIDEILDMKMANELEMALLFSSVLENLNFNPLLIFIDNKIYVGSWLKNDINNEVLNYDITALSKRVSEGVSLICIFNPLCACKTNYKNFIESENIALNDLQSIDEQFLMVDIKRARLMGIKPLPIRVIKDGKYVVTSEEENKSIEYTMPEKLNILNFNTQKADGLSKLPKQKLWERKLLDLSLRNSLINFKNGKNSLTLLGTDLVSLENKLNKEESIEILEIPQEWTEIFKETKDEVLVRSKIKELSKSEFLNNRIRTLLDKENLFEIGKNLEKSSKSSLEENGANTLYLALGLLKWLNPQDKTKERFAPLVLIPVEVEINNLKKSFTLKSRDEEAMFNITLLELLKQDFGLRIEGLDPLPMNEEGIDLVRIFSTIRNSILHQEGWDVKEEAVLGLFSFNKFIMWTDLKNNFDKLKENKIVASLIEGKLTYEKKDIVKTDRYLEDEIKDEKIIFPVSSDLSQSLAVKASYEGESFVLHGPPGTGKSQTITNIIANALLNDKKVLFVAQKMAALEVIERKLEDLGIGAFCLELHSNKSKKTSVLEQLENAMRIVRIKEPAEFNKIYTDNLNKKIELNEINSKLYQTDETGYSLYDLIVENINTSDVKKIISLENFNLNTDIRNIISLLEKLKVSGKNTGGVYKNGLDGIEFIDYRQNLKEKILSLIDINLDTITNLHDINFENKLNIKKIEDLILLNEFIEKALESYEILNAILNDFNYETTLKELKEIYKEYMVYEPSKEMLLSKFTPEIFKLNPDEKLKEYNEIVNSNVLKKLLLGNKVLKELNIVSKGAKITDGDVYKVLENVSIYQKQKSILNKMILKYNDFEFLKDVDSIDLKKLELVINKLENLINSYNKVNKLETEKDLLKNKIINKEQLDSLKDYSNEYNKISNKLIEFNKLTNFNSLSLEEYDGNIYNKYKLKFIEIKDNIDNLREWLNYKEIEKEINLQGLTNLTSEYKNGLIGEEELIPVFKKSILKGKLDKKLSESTDILKLTGFELETKKEQLRKSVEENRLNERKMLYYHLASKIPTLINNETTSKELAILQKAIRGKNKNLSIRSLFKQIPNLLSVTCPCMLMSPMSVAQYLDSSLNTFDLIIFDEASQLPTAEAIGSLGRGKEAIIVGDPKQLPPTTFFNSQNIDEEYVELDDLDNILEDCLALSMPETYLTNHYRSKHESLIEFSNKTNYENKLNTFPSPDDLVSKVTFVKTEGYYDCGKTKQNLAEAEAIVSEIKSRLKDEKLRKLSIGVVTFSSVQEYLIESKLKEALSQDEELDKIFNSLAEPLFIKNLENVQGDERDVILFSVGYGMDENNKLSLNFGPINQEGGWRRLNVAISRARYEMKVFSNITPELFNVSENSARGVVDFKNFLNFAKNNSKVSMLSDINSVDREGELSTIIADELRLRGYKVLTNIGESSFKIDIGIVNPNDSNSYILAIMVGGKSQRNNKSSYDREVLHKSVLQSLGWNVDYVYPIDYFENPKKEIDRLDQLIEKCIRLKNEDNEDNNVDSMDNVKKVKENIDRSKDDVENISQEEVKESIELIYKLNKIDESKITLDEFMKVSNAKLILEKLMNIIELEAPITMNLLAKRTNKIYGVRITDRVIKQIEQILNMVKAKTTKENGSLVYWGSIIDSDNYKNFRKTLPEDNLRELDNISLVEIFNALNFIVTHEGAISEKNLIKETLKILGNYRLTVENERIIKNIIDTSILNSKLKKSAEGYIVLP